MKRLNKSCDTIMGVGIGAVIGSLIALIVVCSN
jgi:gas vesicle protein